MDWNMSDDAEWIEGFAIAFTDAEMMLENKARSLAKAAQEILQKYRETENREPVNLGFVIRIREDTFGPRLHWIKFIGKRRVTRNGQSFAPTQIIKMAGKFAYSDRLFDKFEEPARTDLKMIEIEAALVRQQVEQLKEMKKLFRAVDRSHTVAVEAHNTIIDAL